MTVYILKFSRPLGNPDNPRGQAQYYVGWCRDETSLYARLQVHRAGRGAAITRAAAEQGIGMHIAGILPFGTRADERRIKREKNTKRVLERLRRGAYGKRLYVERDQYSADHAFAPWD